MLELPVLEVDKGLHLFWSVSKPLTNPVGEGITRDISNRAVYIYKYK
jgi:hypothetical protein